MRLLTKFFGSDGALGTAALDATALDTSAQPAADGPASVHRRAEHPRTYLDTSVIASSVPSSTPRERALVAPSDKKAPRRAVASKRDEPAPERSPPDVRRQPTATPIAAPESRPLSSRPPHALVVSPVSLTPEEVQLPPGARQKMPTLFGLGSPLSTPALPDSSAPAELLADFAFKLRCGPLSRAWLPELRRSADVLLLAARHRHAPGLVESLARLLALLADADAGADAVTPLQGSLRDLLLHELSRLAEALHEWPPLARDLEAEAQRREARVARELLAVVDGLRRDVRSRVEALPFEKLASMSAEALAVELETPLERAAELWAVLDGYAQDRMARGPDIGNALALGLALDDLEQKCRAFDACDGEQKDEQRRLRLARRRALAALDVLLAERGELAWLDELEPYSMGERVERLRGWLVASRAGTSRE
jgi:hypothetical protein